LHGTNLIEGGGKVVNRLKRAVLPLLLMVAAGGLAGCGDDGTTSPEGTASVTLLLTDAPGDVDAAWIEVDQVWLQGTDGRHDLVDAPTGWIELTSLPGTAEQLVADVPVPAGTYGQMRLHVVRAALQSGENVYATAGAGDLPASVPPATGTLICPSCSQSGLKVNLNGGFQAESGASAIVVLDFDVARSFGHRAGGSGNWVMHPVMHATEVALSGRIEGTVSLDAAVGAIPDCGGSTRDLTEFIPIATLDGASEGVSASVAEDGTFTFPYLAPGSWQMSFEPEIEYGDPVTEKLVFEATPDPAMATVESEQTSTVDYLITSASCQPVTGGG
jgi:hypothetical protein